MEKLFNNLYLHEIVMLFLGAFLFMILCLGLVYFLLKGQNIKKLLYFFIVSIIMMGYPSIKKIQYQDGMIAIEKYENQILQNPDDEEAKAKLENLLPGVIQRSVSNSNNTDDLIKVAEAYVLIEKPDKAIQLADKGISNEATIEESEEVRKRHISIFQNIKEAASIQKQIIATRSSDSVIPKEQLQKIKTLDPTTQRYLQRKYSPRTIEDKHIIPQ